MARAYLKRLLVIASLIVGVPGTALAAMAVIDQAAIAKLVDQISKLQQQFEELMKITALGKDTVAALGKMGQISIPMLNAARISSQLNRDLQCLIPDMSKLMPGVKFDDASFGSICNASKAYEDNLWIDPDKLKAMPTWQERRRVVDVIERRRERVLADAAAKGMGQGDVAAKQVEKTNKAADELEASAKAATNSNERLAVIAEGQAVMVRAMAQQNQILAQLLKVHSAYVMKAGVPVESLLKAASEETDGSKGTGK